MIARRFGTLAALLITAIPVFALSLDEAFVEAMRLNPEVQVARENARHVHYNVPLSIANWLPTVQVRGASEFFRTDAQGRTLNNERRSMELVLSQNLYAGGRRADLLHQAEEEVRQTHADVEGVEQSVLLRVATANLDVLRAQQTVELRKASLDVYYARSRETKAQFDIGDRTQADLAQADSAWGIAVADVVSAKATLDTQRALFETLVGVPAEELETTRRIPELPETLDAAKRAALQAHPTVRAARHALKAARHALHAAVGESRPRIDLEGSLGRTARDFLPFNTTETRIDLRLIVPLYQAGSGGIRVRRARTVLGLRQAELLLAEREASQQVVGAWNDLNAARERSSALRGAVTASEVALAAVQREAGLGQRTTREVLDAQGSVVTNQVQVLSTDRDLLVNTYRLLAAIGALTARARDIGGVPDLDREAREKRWDLAPAILEIMEE